MTFGIRKVAVGVIAGTAIAAFAVPASAGASGLVHRHSSSPSTLAGAPSQHMTVPLTGTPDTFLAGWYSTVNVTTATTKFSIPTGVCPTNKTTDLGFGVYGFQAGATDANQQSQADVQIDCEGGSLFTFLSAYTFGGGNDILVANPGDVVVATLTEDGTTTTSTVHDLTNHTTARSSGLSSTDSAVNTGAYDYFYPGPITDFGKVKFSKSVINGSNLGLTDPQQLTMEGARPVQITTGALNALGNGFNVTFNHI